MKLRMKYKDKKIKRMKLIAKKKMKIINKFAAIVVVTILCSLNLINSLMFWMQKN